MKYRDEKYIPKRLELMSRMACWAEVPAKEVTPEAEAFSKLVRGLPKDEKLPSYVNNGVECVRVHKDFLGEAAFQRLHEQMMAETGEPGMYLFHETSNGLPSIVSCICAATNREVQFAAQQEHTQTGSLIPSIPQVPPPPCKCNKPVCHIGQDEAIFCVAALTSRAWQVDGQAQLRPKDGAAGEMFSFFVSELHGFGGSGTQKEYKEINKLKKIEQPNHAGWTAPYPSIDSLNYGKNKEGYWTSKEFLQQLKDYVFAFHIRTKDKYQIVMEVDSSSNHLAKKVEGLGERSLGWGGKQRSMRSSILTAGCIDTSNEKYPPRLRIGDTQHMQFQVGDLPPWYDGSVRENDLKWTDMTDLEINEYGPARQKIIDSAAKKKKAAQKKSRTDRFNVQPADSEEQEDDNNNNATANDTSEFIVPGFLHKPKGQKQLLWERGLWKDGMHCSWDTKRRRKAIENGEAIDDTLDATLVLLGCPDFQKENTLIADLLDQTNDIVLLSPKCHPEIAGCGVEYCIGNAKMNFRRDFNDGSTTKLHENSMSSINGVELAMVWKYARRSRDYLHVYRELQEKGVDVDGVVDITGQAKMSWKLLEDMRKKRKTHRNIMEIENRFLRADLPTDASGRKRNKIAWHGQ